MKSFSFPVWGCSDYGSLAPGLCLSTVCTLGEKSLCSFKQESMCQRHCHGNLEVDEEKAAMIVWTELDLLRMLWYFSL